MVYLFRRFGNLTYARCVARPGLGLPAINVVKGFMLHNTFRVNGTKYKRFISNRARESAA